MTTLYMIQLGATPRGRLIEQHDMFFGVGETVNELIPAINNHWSEVKNAWHIDSYRAVTTVINPDNTAYRIKWQEHKTDGNKSNSTDELKLFFLNLGGYQQDSSEEFHHKILVVAPTQGAAIKYARQTDFYKNFSYNDKDTPFKGISHVDDKMEVDVDDIYHVDSLLSSGRLLITPIENTDDINEDKCYVGYLSLKKLKGLSI